MSRYCKRRITQHVALLFLSFACTAVFWAAFSDRKDLISHISIATAYPALLLTAIALVLGPWNVLRRKPNPVSYDLRRDVGIWAGVMATLHTAVGLNVHLRGRPWLYFVNELNRPRSDLFGFGNYTGAVASILFLLLLSISNDFSLRKLGSSRWKSWQRWTYVAMLLSIFHAVGYQNIEKRTVGFEVLVWLLTALLCGFQLGGLRARRLQNR